MSAVASDEVVEPDATDFFVSYCRVDASIVLELCAEWASLGLKVWRDEAKIEVGEEWRLRIQRAIRESKRVVLVVSPAYVRSTECRLEAEYADECGKAIVVASIADVGEGVSLPKWLTERHWARLSQSNPVTAVARQVAAALDSDPAWSAAHARLLEQAYQWNEHRRARTRLLRGRDVDTAERAISIARPPSQPRVTVLQSEFVAQSRRHRTRLLRSIASISLAVTVLALGLAGIAVRQRSAAIEAEQAALEALAESQRLQGEAEARQLAALSTGSDDTRAALLYALEAESWTPEPLPESRSAWLAAVRQFTTASVQDIPFGDRFAAAHQVAWSPDGTRAAIVDEAGDTFVVDEGEAKAASFPSGDGRVGWSPSSGYLYQVASGVVRVSSAQVVDEAPTEFVGEFLGWSPDDQFLAVSPTPDRVELIRLADASRSSIQLPEIEPYAKGISWIDDDRAIVTYWQNIGDEGGFPEAVVASLTGEVLTEPISLGPFDLIAGVTQAWTADAGALGGYSVVAAYGDGRLGTVGFDGTEGPVTVQTGALASLSATWSSDGSRVATSNRDGTVRLFDEVGHLVADLLAPDGPQTLELLWSPSGESVLAIRADGSMHLFDRDGRAIGEPYDLGVIDGINDVEWDPSESVVAVSSTGRAVRFLQAGDGEAAASDPLPRTDEVAWAPDSSKFAISDIEGGITVYAFDGTVLTPRFFAHEGAVVSMSWSPSGDQLAASFLDGAFKLVDGSGQPVVTMIEALPGYFVGDVEWSRDGSIVGGNAVEPMYFDTAGNLLEGVDSVDSVNGGGSALDATVLTGGTVEVRDSTGRLVFTTELTAGVDLAQLAPAPDGSYVVMLTRLGRTIVVDAKGNEVATPLPPAAGLAWAPNSQAIVVLTAAGGFEVDYIVTEADVCQYLRQSMGDAFIKQLVAIPGRASRCVADQLTPPPPFPASLMPPSELRSLSG